MNKLKGSISSIITHENLSLIYVLVNNATVTSIVLDNSNDLLKINNEVFVVFKETEVIIGLGKELAISMQNKFFGTIISIDSNVVLSKLIINTTIGEITSIITTNAVKQLKLIVGTEVTVMIKTNEILLLEC